LHIGDFKPAEEAIESLRTFFKTLKFEVHDHQRNLTLKDMADFCLAVCARENEEYDFLIVIIVAHGQMVAGSEQVPGGPEGGPMLYLLPPSPSPSGFDGCFSTWVPPNF
jgi:hypothetical protein